MNLYHNNYYFNQRRISDSSSNNLMSDKRSRMIQYNDKITNRNVYRNFQYDSNNAPYFSKKASSNKDFINYQKINLNDYKTDYFSNKINNFFINDNDLKLTNNYSKTKNDIHFGNDNLNYKRDSNEYNKKYSIFNNANNLNPKTEITRHKISRIEDKKEKKYSAIDNNYISNYRENLDRFSHQSNNNGYLLNKKLDELEKGINKKSNNTNEISNQKNDNILNKDKLTMKYLYEEQRSNNNDIDKYKNQLINFERNKKIINNENKIEKEETKDNNIKFRVNHGYEENIESKSNEEKLKPNINRSKSVAPNKNVISENAKISNSLVGLNNLGATCYMNSALQNIIHCKSFIDKIKVFQNSNILDKSITNSFINLCNSLIDSKNKEPRRYYSYTSSLNSISPSNFKLSFCLKHKDYMRGQHDSIEFLRTLLDDMSKEININQNISAYKELTTEGKSKEEQCKEYHNFFKSRENSIIVDIFYNQIINIFTCTCGFESYSFQKLLDIPLLLPNKDYKTSLSSLINEYFKEEELEWSSKCENCKKPDLKHLKITKCCILNEIVIFSLQRFDPVLSMKNNIRVSFDEIIDLKEYCDNDLFKENTKYRLLGTINHIGNINYGHYYAYIRIGENWYEFNDSIVKKAYKMDYDNSSVCVLFYEKL